MPKCQHFVESSRSVLAGRAGGTKQVLGNGLATELLEELEIHTNNLKRHAVQGCASPLNFRWGGFDGVMAERLDRAS